MELVSRLPHYLSGSTHGHLDRRFHRWKASRKRTASQRIHTRFIQKTRLSARKPFLLDLMRRRAHVRRNTRASGSVVNAQRVHVRVRLLPAKMVHRMFSCWHGELESGDGEGQKGIHRQHRTEQGTRRWILRRGNTTKGGGGE